MKKKAGRCYAVARGRAPGIYDSWEGPSGARVQVEGFPGALYRGFASREDAALFIGREGRASEPPKPKRLGKDGLGAHEPRAGQVVIYTDGGCIGNPGPGGWAAVIVRDGRREEISGGFRLTTNNRMELYACIQALRALGEKDRDVRLFTDSQYIVLAIEKGWARRWRSSGWMRDKTHPALNPDLWSELLDLLDGRPVAFSWVRGHAGQPENERCDELARRAALGPDLAVDEGYEGRRG